MASASSSIPYNNPHKLVQFDAKISKYPCFYTWVPSRSTSYILDNMEDVDQSSDWLLPSQPSATDDIFRNPRKTPRVGDEYQAEIPNLTTKDDLFQLIKSPTFQDSNIDLQNHSNSDSFPVRDSLDESWSIIDRESFLLGLYIFGKNLRFVKKFVGNKVMGNVLSYYYGVFYKSTEYRSWSKFRKKKSKKSTPGERIFTAWRQQELLSRLSSHVTEECLNSLVEAGKMYGDGKLSLEEYVFTLKDRIGINLLVDAVAIGKGKRDLTKTAMEPPKTNSDCPRKESLSGKSCSSLTMEEIVQFLNGDVRLSKAKSNDLFWEAVWPRLLARGWRSEQPRNYVFQKSKHLLVFLLPGIGKFSRKLQKGSHYFDSHTDVLNKVAFEPELLELVDPHTRRGSDDEQDDSVKFTIVDTSFVNVRELKRLPVFEPPHKPASSSQEIEQDSAKEPQSEDSSHENLDPDAQYVLDSAESQTCMVNNVMVSRTQHKKTNLFNGKSRRKVKSMSTRKAKPQRSKDLEGPMIERHDFDSYIESKPDETTIECHGFQEMPPLRDDECQEVVKEPCAEKKRRRICIDLNLPHSDPDSNNNEPLVSTNSELSGSMNAADQQSLVNGQRQSTRNRPLTTKALEALALGFLRPKKKRKGVEERPPRRVRPKTALVSACGARGNIRCNDDIDSHPIRFVEN